MRLKPCNAALNIFEQSNFDSPITCINKTGCVYASVIIVVQTTSLTLSQRSTKETVSQIQMCALISLIILDVQCYIKAQSCFKLSDYQK